MRARTEATTPKAIVLMISGVMFLSTWVDSHVWIHASHKDTGRELKK